VFVNARLVYALSVGATRDSCPAPICMECAARWHVIHETRRYISGLPCPSICDSEHMRRRTPIMQVSTRSSRFRRLSPLLCTRTSILGDFNVEWCTVLISSPRQVLQHHIVTPANTLDDTDADAKTRDESRDRTLPMLAIPSSQHVCCGPTGFLFVVDLS